MLHLFSQVNLQLHIEDILWVKPVSLAPCVGLASSSTKGWKGVKLPTAVPSTACSAAKYFRRGVRGRSTWRRTKTWSHSCAESVVRVSTDRSISRDTCWATRPHALTSVAAASRTYARNTCNATRAPLQHASTWLSGRSLARLASKGSYGESTSSDIPRRLTTSSCPTTSRSPGSSTVPSVRKHSPEGSIYDVIDWFTRGRKVRLWKPILKTTSLPRPAQKKQALLLKKFIRLLNVKFALKPSPVDPMYWDTWNESTTQPYLGRFTAVMFATNSLAESIT